MRVLSLGRTGKARLAVQTEHGSQLCVQLTIELEMWPRIRAFHRVKLRRGSTFVWLQKNLSSLESICKHKQAERILCSMCKMQLRIHSCLKIPFMGNLEVYKIRYRCVHVYTVVADM